MSDFNNRYWTAFNHLKSIFSNLSGLTDYYFHQLSSTSFDNDTRSSFTYICSLTYGDLIIVEFKYIIYVVTDSNSNYVYDEKICGSDCNDYHMGLLTNKKDYNSILSNIINSHPYDTDSSIDYIDDLHNQIYSEYSKLCCLLRC